MSPIDIDQILEAYDRAWQRGSRPALAAYLSLPDGHPQRSELTIYLTHIDLEYRLKAGDQAPLVETYLQLFPQAFSDPAETLRLIAIEYQTLWRRQKGVRRADYLRRFPTFAVELAAQLKPRRDCPRCQKSLEIEDEAADSATCPCCRNVFAIRRQADDVETILESTRVESAPQNHWPRIPGFEILSELGKGGMGVVFKARQVNVLDRIVALKLMRAGPHARPEDLARFMTEAKAVASLEHPHIVRIYEMNEHAGQAYIALECIEGGSLDKKLAGKPQPFRAAAVLVETLARTIHVVHRHGIIHRDLKPGNVLLASDGSPKITDFGLAKHMHDALVGMTPADAILGTPEYMPPEQAAGKSQEIGPSVDVYALGAILYEMITGRPPFCNANRMETLQLVLRAEPTPPRRLRPDTPRDLETICLKCLRKEPAERYASAQDLADDLGRFLKGEPIRARPVGLVEHGIKWVRRNHALAGVIALALLMALGAVGWLWHTHNVRTERRQRAVDKAVDDALGGNQVLAEQAIAAAEIQGVSDGQLHFLRGLTYFHQSDPKPAIEHLEKAAQLLPDNVAVRALLAIFHERAGEWEMHSRWMKEVNAMEARTPDDLLFVGCVQSLLDPKGALDTLDKSIASGDRPIARAIRAQARARFALEWSDSDRAAGARADADAALPYLPDSPFVFAVSAQVEYVVFVLRKDVGESKEERKKKLGKMRENLAALAKYPDYPSATIYLCLYHQAVDEDTEASEVLRKAALLSDQSDAIAEYATDLYRHGRIDEALGWLKKQNSERLSWHADFLKVCLIAEKNDREANERAFDDWKKRNAAADADLYGAFLLLLQGRKDEVKTYATESLAFNWRSGSPEKVRYREQVREFVQAFASGKQPKPDGLINAAGKMRSWQTRARFLIAITCLADGKRDDAKRHFQMAVDRRGYMAGAYWMSQAMLTRCSRDDAWPSWLPPAQR